MSNTTPERWLPVVGYEGQYEVSDHGRARSVDRVVVRTSGEMHLKGKVLSPGIDRYARPLVILCVNKIKVTKLVAHLVAETFIGPRPPGQVVRHLDDNPHNNRLSNICYGTPAENERDKLLNGGNYLAAREACPLNHKLIEPNLKTWHLARGHRVCLACSRARSNAWAHPEINFRSTAHEHYEKIMSEVLGN